MFKLSKKESAALQHGYLTCLKNEYAIIKASGVTVLDYLQGQIAQDMKQLTESGRASINNPTLPRQDKSPDPYRC